MAQCLAAVYLLSPSGTWLCLYVLPLTLEAYVFPKYVSFYLCCRIPDSYAAMYCVLYDAVIGNSDIVL